MSTPGAESTPNRPPDWHHLPENPWNPHAWIIGEPEVGAGTWIGAFTVIDGSGGLAIGQGCDISAGAQIYSHSTVARAISKREHPIQHEPTRIGNHVHVGANATILMGTTIGDHSIVAAGAVVTQGTIAPAWSLLVGVPARVVPDGARGVAGVSSDSTNSEGNPEATST